MKRYSLVSLRTPAGHRSLAKLNQGIVIETGYGRSLVQFPAPPASGCDSERMWCDNADLIVTPTPPPEIYDPRDVAQAAAELEAISAAECAYEAANLEAMWAAEAAR